MKARPSMEKRRKELARQERQQAKVERRKRRKDDPLAETGTEEADAIAQLGVAPERSPDEHPEPE